MSRKMIGDKPLTNAEKQKRYRATHKMVPRAECHVCSSTWAVRDILHAKTFHFKTFQDLIVWVKEME